MWRLRPKAQSRTQSLPNPKDEGETDEREILRSLIQRFPFWTHGRGILARYSLEANDIATAYAEAHALRVLSSDRSPLRATSLALLGQCYLRRGDGVGALPLLNQASELRPHDLRIREDQAAALVLVGDKIKAIDILKGIPTANLSAEGKAALQWLTSTPQ